MPRNKALPGTTLGPADIHWGADRTRRRMRLRHESTGPFSPGDGTVAGLVEWLRGDSIVGYTDGQEITTAWPALAGVNADPVGTTKPHYLANFANGKPGVGNADPQVAGGSYFQIVGGNVPAALATQPNTHFIVFTLKTQAAGGHYMDAQTDRNLVGDPAAGPNYGYYAGSVVDSSTVLDTTSTPHILVAQFNGASSHLWRDGGTAIADGNPGTKGISGNWYVAFDPGGNSSVGTHGEIISYHAALSLADINRVGAYLGARYNITWTTAV